MRPESEADLSEAIAAAGGPLHIVGGGTRTGRKSDQGEILETSGLSGITLYEPEALTMVAGAGTPLAKIEAALASEDQMLSFEPPDTSGLFGVESRSTIGGVVATNASGPRRIQAGACRDLLLGVRLVDGRGDIIKNGGRVMKNVTGYDLVKLACGSHGTLGVLTEVSFKVLPKPEARAVLLIEGLTDAEAISTLSTALGAPYDVTGAAHFPVGMDGDPVTMIRLEGFENAVSYRAERLRDLLGKGREIAIETDANRTRAGWVWVQDRGFALRCR
jgi:glycolate oxidase FAD binding subunit